MRIFVAGGSGTIGVPLVRALIAAGHQVTAMTRSPRKEGELRAFGASVVVADALDRAALIRAVAEARPTHVIHQLTAIPKAGVSRPADLEPTNRLRIEGTRNLLDAAIAAGARRFLVGSFAMLSSGDPGAMSAEPAAVATRSMETQVLEATARGGIEGVILRYGLFYGPGAPSTTDMVEKVRRRRLPVVRGDSGQLPVIHLDDAVSATVLALDRAPAGAVYDIVDDRAVSLTEIVEKIAENTGSAAPWHVPAWIPRLLAPYMARLLSMRMPLSNAKAKADLGWRPSTRQYARASRRSHQARPPERGPDQCDMDDVFNTDRPRLFSIAYRMLGSASDAEDVLQDAWLRYSAADRSAIRSPNAFATTIVTRLCLDRLKSARATREVYVGPWLPEPVLTSEVESPATMLQRAESVTLAFLVLLEKLSPEERAVFLLKDIFEYDHGEVAEMLGTTVENSRQLLHRAKARLAEERPRLTGTPESRRAVAERFARAFSSGDGAELTSLLSADVGMWSDGGGKALAARRPLLGRDSVLNFLLGLHRSAQAAGVRDVSLRIEDVNFEPAIVMHVGGRLESIFVISIEGETVTGLRIVRNPDKLARIDRSLAVH